MISVYLFHVDTSHLIVGEQKPFAYCLLIKKKKEEKQARKLYSTELGFYIPTTIYFMIPIPMQHCSIYQAIITRSVLKRLRI